MRTIITTILATTLFASSAVAAPKAKIEKESVKAHEVTPVLYKADKNGFTLNVDLEGEMYTVDVDETRQFTSMSVYDGHDTLVNSVVVHNNKKGSLLLDSNGLVEWSQYAISMDAIERQGWQAQLLTDPAFVQLMIDEVSPGSEPAALAWLGWGVIAACLNAEISYTSNSDGTSSWSVTVGWDCPGLE